MKATFSLLDIAYSDLNASIILFENKFYPQSIFYMQQAVEKSIKQLGVYNGVVKPSDLQKDIGHKTEKIFKRVVGHVKHLTGDSDADINNSYNDLKHLLKKAGLKEAKDVIINVLDENQQLEIPSEVIELMIDIIIKKQAPGFPDKLKRNGNIEFEFSRMKNNFNNYFLA